MLRAPSDEPQFSTLGGSRTPETRSAKSVGGAFLKKDALSPLMEAGKEKTVCGLDGDKQASVIKRLKVHTQTKTA